MNEKYDVEVVKKAEGEMLLNLFETVNRDRRKRGRPGLKLILFANAEEISTYITNALEVVDDMAEMQVTGRNILYIEETESTNTHMDLYKTPLRTVPSAHTAML